MQAYQERALAEQEQLSHKVEMLTTFTEGTIFPTVDHLEKGRLLQQLSYMTGYLRVLEQRIAAFDLT